MQLEIHYFRLGGGTGFIGSHLVKILSSAGYETLTVSRMPGVKRITWHELESKGLPENTFAAVNVAGQNVLDVTRRWSPSFKQNVWNSRVNTTAAIAKAIIKADKKPQAFINISGVSLYRPSAEKIYTEHDDGENYDYMSNLCLHWEKAAQLPPTESTTRQVSCGNLSLYRLSTDVCSYPFYGRYAFARVLLLVETVE